MFFFFFFFSLPFSVGFQGPPEAVPTSPAFEHSPRSIVSWFLPYVVFSLSRTIHTELFVVNRTYSRTLSTLTPSLPFASLLLTSIFLDFLSDLVCLYTFLGLSSGNCSFLILSPRNPPARFRPTILPVVFVIDLSNFQAKRDPYSSPLSPPQSFGFFAVPFFSYP